MNWRAVLSVVLAPALLAGCTTGPGLWACDVSVAVLEGASCEINCNTKYGRLGRENYAYQRCLYDCREANNKKQCTRPLKKPRRTRYPDLLYSSIWDVIPDISMPPCVKWECC